MKPIVINKLNDNSLIPVSWLEGSEELYSQDFVTVRELLSYNSNYTTNIYGTLMVTPGSNINIQASNIMLSGEFVWNNDTATSIPLWYKHNIYQPVDIIEEIVVTKTLSNVAVGTTIITISDLINKDGFYILRNSIEFKIDGTQQPPTSYYTNYGEEYLQVDITNINTTTHNISLTYKIVKLSIELSINNNFKFNLIVNHHYGDLAIVTILFDVFLTGELIYTSNKSKIVELLNLTNLYTKVATNMVNENTYTYSYNGNIEFPSRHVFAIFAVKPDNNNYSSIVYADVKAGLSIDEPWYITLHGSYSVNYPIKEYEYIQPNIIFHNEINSMINQTEIMLVHPNALWHADSSNTITGISVSFLDDPTVMLQVESYNEQTNIVKLINNVPIGTNMICKYGSINYNIDYDYLQLNPTLNKQDDLYNNYVLLYIDLSTPDRNIYHMFLPKIVNDQVVIYTHNKVITDLQLLIPNAMPFMLFMINEPVDSDFFSVFDFTTRGGYNISSNTVTDSIYWDGEDVDISGNIYARIPKVLVENLTNNIMEWNDIELLDAEVQAKESIIEHIENTKRLGMNIITEWEE